MEMLVNILINRRTFNFGIGTVAGVAAAGLPIFGQIKPAAAYLYCRKSISGMIWVNYGNRTEIYGSR